MATQIGHNRGRKVFYIMWVSSRQNGLRGIWQSETQTSLPSYRDQLEYWNFACSKFRYNTFQLANNKGTDQSARMRRLVCAFVVHKPRRQVLLRWGPCYNNNNNIQQSTFLSLITAVFNLLHYYNIYILKILQTRKVLTEKTHFHSVKVPVTLKTGT